MRVRLAKVQPRSLRDERVCDHHFGIALEFKPDAVISEVHPCTSPIRAIVIDFLPSDGLVACEDAIKELSQPE